MSKFHVNDNGLSGRCEAEKVKCPFGGDSGQENHYATLDEAIAASETLMEQEHGVFQTQKKNKYSDEDWSKMPSPAEWEPTNVEGLDIEDIESPYMNYRTDSVSYKTDGTRVGGADMEDYVAGYFGLSSKDELPQSVKDLIKRRANDWVSDGFNTELRDGEDDDGRSITYTEVTPPGSLEDDLTDHYHKMTNK